MRTRLAPLPAMDSKTAARESVVSSDPEKHSLDHESKYSGNEEQLLATPTLEVTFNLTLRRRTIVLAILCVSSALNGAYPSVVFGALPKISLDLKFPAGTDQWMISAYTLTYASTMLIMGRIADVHDPKLPFCMGTLIIGLLAVPFAASPSPVLSIVMAALQGIGNAMNVPTAIAMLNRTFPDAGKKSNALGIYVGVASIGATVGIILGGLLATYSTWRWGFYIMAILIIPYSIASWFLLPSYKTSATFDWRKVDFPGVLALTTGLCLFSYAISQGNVAGWSSPQTLATLIISVVLFGVFLCVEYFVENPALPLSIWTTRFTPLFFYGLSIFWYAYGAQILCISLFTGLWQLSYLSAALRSIPFRLCSGIAEYLAGTLALKLPRRWLLILGQVFMGAGAVLFAFADTSDKYWSHIFPGAIIGFGGAGFAYVACLATVMADTKAEAGGVISAAMYTAIQLGATIGLAVVTSINLGVTNHQKAESFDPHKGFEAAFWSILGMDGLMILFCLLTIRHDQ